MVGELDESDFHYLPAYGTYPPLDRSTSVREHLLYCTSGRSTPISAGQCYCQGKGFSKSWLSKFLFFFRFLRFVSVFGGEDVTTSVRSATNQDCRKIIGQEVPDWFFQHLLQNKLLPTSFGTKTSFTSFTEQISTKNLSRLWKSSYQKNHHHTLTLADITQWDATIWWRGSELLHYRFCTEGSSVLRLAKEKSSMIF